MQRTIGWFSESILCFFGINTLFDVEINSKASRTVSKHTRPGANIAEGEIQTLGDTSQKI